MQISTLLKRRIRSLSTNPSRLFVLSGGATLSSMPGLDRLREFGQASSLLLADCAPRRFNDWRASRWPKLVLLVGQQGFQLLREHPAGQQELAHGSLDSETLEASLEQHADPNAKVQLKLADQQILIRRIRLPKQAKKHLQQVMRHEINRFTPFEPKQIFFDVQLLDDVQGNQLSADLAICMRSEVEPWLERLTALGIPPSRVCWGSAWPDANLLPVDRRPPRHWLRPLLSLILPVLVLGLLVAVMLTPVSQKEEVHQELRNRVSAIRSEALQADELRAALATARSDNTKVLRIKRDQPMLTDLLLELTELLPDESYLDTIVYEYGRVDLRGQSASATALVERLSKAPGITDVRFRSPVVQVDQGRRERFHIEFRYGRPDR